jgi:thiamine biosynthesis lipoprotein
MTLPEPVAVRKFSRAVRLMGNSFVFTVIADDEEFAHNHISEAIAEVQRIERLLTTFSGDSETARINESAGIQPVCVSQEVFNLIARAQRISALTQGAFDLSYGSIDKRFWNFDVKMTALPDRKKALASIRLINYQHIILNPDDHTVFLKEAGMRIGFGGIGKGYAAFMAAEVLKNAGIAHGVVNAAGDLLAWGNQPDGHPWTIGIADPDHQHQVFSSFQISGLAVATSGNYEKFALINGRRYSHTIDPKTGFPVSGIKSVTIICPNAELADALTTPVMVMGVKAGIGMINQMKGIACIIVDDSDKLHTSKNIHLT